MQTYRSIFNRKQESFLTFPTIFPKCNHCSFKAVPISIGMYVKLPIVLFFYIRIWNVLYVLLFYVDVLKMFLKELQT